MHYSDLKDKTALITGASSGLGKEMAIALVNNGAKVILLSHDQEKLEEVSKEIGGDNKIEVCDVSNKTEVKRIFIDLESRPIDIVINDAAIALTTPIFSDEDENDEDFERVIRTNLMGVWYITKAAAHHMKKFKIEGSIINISSVSGTNFLNEDFSGYAVSKAGIIQMTKALVSELSREKIRINAVAPGLFHTRMTEHWLDTEEKRMQWEKEIPLQFIAEPKEIIGMILYLASNEASRYVTGSVMTIDGGISCFRSRGS